MSSSTQEIHEFLKSGQGSVNAKLVYVNYSNTDQTKELCYIDFSEEVDTPVVHKISAATDAHVPVISPDGNWVVYATGKGTEVGSPVSMRSSVYLCKIEENAVPVLVAADSACEPRFIQNTDTLTIIYSTLAPNYAWEGCGKTMKVKIDISGEPPVVDTPRVLFEHGSYTGGLSWDGIFLCSGGGDIVMLDLTSGNTRPDTVSYCKQSCNASISSSRKYTNCMMHVTMAGSHPLINGGKKWEMWQVILINNSKGDILKGYWYPTQYKFPLQTDPESLDKARWHHCEWSNHPYFATATLNADRYYKVGDEYVNTKYQERIYLANLKDSSYLEILRPDTIKHSGIPDDNAGLHWPWLWVKIPDGFIEDSSWLDAITNIGTFPSTKTNYCTNNLIQFNNNIITSVYPVSAISIYRVDGKFIRRIIPDKATKTMALSILKNISAGAYIIHIETIRNISSRFLFVQM